jgi:DNA (cytosine-5)-methyltransferase 1
MQYPSEASMRFFSDRFASKVQKQNICAVDLYAGAGGLSLGLQWAGIKVVAAVEVDDWAASTYCQNLSDAVVHVGRVSELTEAFFERHRGVEIVVGGPPCQGFSVSASSRRKENDARNQEVFHFLDAAIRLKPSVIVMENVPAMPTVLDPSGVLVIDLAINKLRRAGYDSRLHNIDAADFGVPQRRQRVFLIAARGDVPDLLSERTHWSRSTASSRPRWRSTIEAIGDLPRVAAGAVGEEDCLTYDRDPKNEYQIALRAKGGSFFNHVPMRHSPRLVARFSAIPIGGNGASVWSEHPAKRRGRSDANGVPFGQNHRRIQPNVPSPTITAYMYSTCLHPTQHRNITVREAARIQSFPDSFQFMGKRTTLSMKLLERKGLLSDMKLNQLNQVGNAVPPLLGRAVGRAISRLFVE